MRILVVATKSPWPPADGGRLALWLMLQALAEHGHAVALVAPCAQPPGDEQRRALAQVCEAHLLPQRPLPWPRALAQSLLRGEPASLCRHRSVAVQRRVQDLLRHWRPQLVHVEQLQAWANAEPAWRSGLPAVLRMQNVESDLWQQQAAWRWPALPWRVEAARLRDYERRAMRQAGRVLAITTRDAVQLQTLLPADEAARVQAWVPPFPAHLPAGPACPGEPALALAGSAGWWPNAQALRWFIDAVLPRLRQRSPALLAHVYGALPRGARDLRGLVEHAAPADSRFAFPEGAVAAVPLAVGSGIRMRILEAWARGLPVLASTVAARGLQAEDGRELRIADTAEAFADAAVELASDADLRARLVQAGRDYLLREHDPRQQVQALLQHYCSLLP